MAVVAFVAAGTYTPYSQKRKKGHAADTTVRKDTLKRADSLRKQGTPEFDSLQKKLSPTVDTTRMDSLQLAVYKRHRRFYTPRFHQPSEKEWY